MFTFVFNQFIKPCHHQTFCSRLISRSLSDIRVRFAPSPTGFLHLGGLRTALYNYLFARKHNGKFILRIEDTDQDRLVANAIKSMEDNLIWSGLVPDEGPSFGGHHGPYIQSQRLDSYKERVNILLNSGHAYRCFCSDMRLNLLRKEAAKNRHTPKYDNKCRNLDIKEIEDKLSNGVPYTVRLKIKEGPVTFDDYVYGQVSIDLSLNEADPIIFKSDGFPTYHFANVVDDHDMQISHVLRGVEWQLSTPKHLMLYEAFNWTPPVYVHLPLILNKDGTKLSKRQSDIKIETYRELGYYPEAIINYLTIIGGGFGSQTGDKISGMNELVESFNLAKVNTNSSRFETEKIKLYNRLCIETYIKNNRIDLLMEDLRKLLADKYNHSNDNVEELSFDEEYFMKIIKHNWERIFTIKDLITDEFQYLWQTPKYDWDVQSLSEQHDLDNLLNQMSISIKEWDTNQFNNKQFLSDKTMEEFKSKFESKINYKIFMKLLRLSLTNLKKGPPVAEIMELIGKDRTLKYIACARVYIMSKSSSSQQRQDHLI